MVNVTIKYSMKREKLMKLKKKYKKYVFLWKNYVFEKMLKNFDETMKYSINHEK